MKKDMKKVLLVILGAILLLGGWIGLVKSGLLTIPAPYGHTAVYSLDGSPAKYIYNSVYGVKDPNKVYEPDWAALALFSNIPYRHGEGTVWFDKYPYYFRGDAIYFNTYHFVLVPEEYWEELRNNTDFSKLIDWAPGPLWSWQTQTLREEVK